MKNGLKVIMLMGVLIIGLTGCTGKNTETNKPETSKTATAQVREKAPASGEKAAVTSSEVNNTPAPAVTTKPSAAPINEAVKEVPKVSPNQTQAPVVKETPKPSTPAVQKGSNSEYRSEAPVTSIDTIQISPAHVYYKDSKLYMEAYIYNGFKHNVFDIRNVEISLSNKTNIVAEASFSGIENKVIGPNSYIVWTFVFSDAALKQSNADLSYIKTNYKCGNSF